MPRRIPAALAVSALMLIALASACASSGEGGREVAITQRDDGCAPKSIDVTPGEKLKLVVKNDSGSDYEVEGIDGTKLEEVVVPEGRTRTPGYTVPSAASGTYKIKCYIPAGIATIIELVAGDGAGSDPTAEPDPEADATKETTSNGDENNVVARLTEWKIEAAPATVAAGSVSFKATNDSPAMIHELAVLKVLEGDEFELQGEIEDIDPGASGEISLDLASGTYQLACLIVPGEAGSTEDHLAQGMKTRIVVE